MEKVAGDHVTIDEIEKGSLIAGDIQGAVANRNANIGGFGMLYADGKKNRASAGSADPKIPGLRTKVLPYLVAEGDLVGYAITVFIPVPGAAP